MRFIPNAASATILAIAGYFAVLWGTEAIQVLASMNYGIGDYGGSQVVYGYGRLFGLSSDGLIRLAAFFAASKLAAAIAFAMHLVGRVRAFRNGKSDAEMLEAALILVVLLTLTMAVPAMVENNGNLIRLHGLFLLLAGVAAMLSATEGLVLARTELPATRAGRLAAAEPAIVDATERGALRQRVLMWLCTSGRTPA